jgi:undecaprenyl-diphosphatase
LVVLLAVFAVVAACWGFYEIAGRVTSGDTKQFDDRVIAALRNPLDERLPLGPVWFVEAVRDVSALGSAAVVVLMLLATAGYLALKRQYGPLVVAVLAASTGGAFSELMKHHFSRPRPPLGSALTTPLSSSFPSGHSLLSAIVYLLLGAMLARSEARWSAKLYFVGVAMTLVFLIGASRVLLGVHYPSDVLAGWTAGLGWASGWWLISRWLERRALRSTQQGFNAQSPGH